MPMDLISHLLDCLEEEGLEVGKECSKAKRFGGDDRNPNVPNSPTNYENIAAELDDMRGVLNKLAEHGITFPSNPARIKAKEEKLERMIQYARDRGQIL